MRNVVISLAIWVSALPTHAIPFGWTASEASCARSVGISLEKESHSADPACIRHLAWLSDVVIYGEVDSLHRDPSSVYPTTLAVRVLSTMKGALFVGEFAHVALRSGLVHDEPSSRIMDQFLIGEPTFSIGERVLLFLTTRARYDPAAPTRYLLPAGHFHLVENEKWVVQQGLVWNVNDPSKKHTASWVDREVAVSVAAQSTECR